jgi:DNA-directed RNA polymerase specialized sigma24 family protein
MDAPQDSFRSSLDKLRQGEDAGVQAAWNTYFERLARIANQKLSAGVRRTTDGEDVALSVMLTICRRAGAGELDGVADRDELWRLMLTILYHKAADRGRHHRAAKRGGGNVRGDSVFLGPQSDMDRLAFAQFAADDPTPDLLVQLEDEHRQLFERLEDDLLRQIAQHRLEGESTEEIAARLDISPRTVRRKLDLIRQSWAALLDGSV